MVFTDADWTNNRADTIPAYGCVFSFCRKQKRVSK